MHTRRTRVYLLRKSLALLCLPKKCAFYADTDTLIHLRACRKFTLSAMEENDIKTCNEEARPILISFSGSVQRSQTRIDLNELGKGEDDIVVGGGSEMFARMNTTDAGEAFSRLAKQSLFAAASRGASEKGASKQYAGGHCMKIN